MSLLDFLNLISRRTCQFGRTALRCKGLWQYRWVCLRNGNSSYDHEGTGAWPRTFSRIPRKHGSGEPHQLHHRFRRSRLLGRGRWRGAVGQRLREGRALCTLLLPHRPLALRSACHQLGQRGEKRGGEASAAPVSAGPTAAVARCSERTNRHGSRRGRGGGLGRGHGWGCGAAAAIRRQRRARPCTF